MSDGYKEKNETKADAIHAGMEETAAKSAATKDIDEIPAEEVCCCHSDKTKMRSEKEVKDLLNRLNRIEGQVRGLKGMVERNAYCPDIMTQVSAVSAALASFNRLLLSNHVRTCVAEDIRQGNDEVIDELLKTLQKMMR